MDLGLIIVTPHGDHSPVFTLLKGKRGRFGRKTDFGSWTRDIGLSRHHCEVWRDDAGVWIRDLDSRNGTFVIHGSPFTKERVREPTRLRPCDWFHIGSTRVRLVFDGLIEPGWLAWGNRTVPKIAKAILEEAGFNERVAILHDALIDAGCNDADLLEHCRIPCPHQAACCLPRFLLGVGRLSPGRSD